MKDLEISVFADFYGKLLSPRALRILRQYYDEDMSLAEIAEEFGITRQGVKDSIDKSSRYLADCEERLGLYRTRQDALKIIENALSGGDPVSALYELKTLLK